MGSKKVVIVADGVAYQVTIENGMGSVVVLDAEKTADAMKDADSAQGAMCAKLDSATAALGIMATLVNV